MKIHKIQACDNSIIFQGKSNKHTQKINKGNTTANSVVNLSSSNYINTNLEDNLYRSSLIRAARLQEVTLDKIKSILGPNETKKVLSELNTNEQNFIASDKNIETGKFRANLHIHTTASDGYYTPIELLEDASNYANKVYAKTGKPFTIAITDHDTISAYPEIIEEVAKNSDKYKNLRIILGMEATTYENINNKPIQFHTLIYNINPDDEKFKIFLEKQAEKKHILSKFVINKINKNYTSIFHKGDLLSFEEFTNMYPPMKKGIISPHNYLRNYTMTKFIVSEIITKLDILKDYFKNTNPEFDIYIEMQKIKNFQYGISHNNNAPTAYNGIIEYYTNFANVEENKLAKEISSFANKSEKIINFIKNTNNELVEHRNINNQNFYANINEIYNSLSNQPNAIIGIAHPLNITIDKTDNDNFDVFADVLHKRKQTGNKENHTLEFLTNFYKRFKETAKEKAKFSEVFYQSYHSKKGEAQTPLEIAKHLFNLSKVNKLLKTGGYDSHRKTIFSRY